MSNFCGIKSCKYLKKTANKVSLFRVRSKEQLTKWKNVLDDDCTSPSFRICSRHFRESDIVRVYPTVEAPRGFAGDTALPLERGRPTLSPKAVPSLLLGGNPPLSLNKKKKKKPSKKSSLAKEPIEKQDDFYDVFTAIECQCKASDPPQQQNIVISINSYRVRLINLKLPSSMWKLFDFEKETFISHIKVKKGVPFSDKTLVIQEGQNPKVILNGVKYMETDPNIDFQELLNEINDTKVCIGNNSLGACLGINRTARKQCLPCQFITNQKIREVLDE